MFLKAARHAELDTMRGISANVMCGQEGLYGTSAFQVLLNIDEMMKLENQKQYVPPTNDVEQFFEEKKEVSNCDRIIGQNNVSTIKATDLGQVNADYDMGF